MVDGEVTKEDHARKRGLGVRDVDRCKDVNGSHGHATGDAVLSAVARRCVGEPRQADLLGRLGVEELAVLLPEADEAHAVSWTGTARPSAPMRRASRPR